MDTVTLEVTSLVHSSQHISYEYFIIWTFIGAGIYKHCNKINTRTKNFAAFCNFFNFVLMQISGIQNF
jgi:hypothetical protein